MPGYSPVYTGGLYPPAGKCILALQNGDIIEPEVGGNNDDAPPEACNPETRSGEHVRANLAAAVSAPDICVPALHSYLSNI